jgi:hypothetical protein
MAQLSEAQVDYVVLSKVLLKESTWRLWKRHVPYAPYFADDRYLVYATVPEFGRDLDPPQELLPGLGIVDQSLSSFCSTEQIVVVAALTWASTETLPKDYAVQFTADSEKTGERIQAPAELLADSWPTTQWPAGTVTRQAYSMTLPADGFPYFVSLHALDAEQGTVSGDPLLRGLIDGDSCTIDASAAPAANVLFGDNLRLLSYQVAQKESDLLVNLYWLADERPAYAYKFFIHVYDPQTKEIVAQIDTVPLDYRLPTTDWRNGELVADEISLSLADLIPGEYELAVGVYNADTGQRLPLTGGTDSLQISEDGRLFLPEQVQIPAR